MMQNASPRRHWLGLISVICLVAIVASAAMPWPRGLEPLAGLAESRPKQTANLGTPVPSAKPGQGKSEDPLDGDPLDGSPPGVDSDAPRHETRLTIERSGRPNAAPSSLVAYDNDPATVWAPEVDGVEPWLWLDLGDERQVREVRWLAKGAGTIAVSISNDRNRWQEIDSAEVERGWQSIELLDDARFVRLDLETDEEGVLPAIAEVSVYGQDADQSTDRAQKAKDDGKDKKGKKHGKDRKQKNSNSDANKNNKGGNQEKRAKGNKSGNSQTVTETENVSAQSGETDCDGKRARCRTRQGEIDVEDDCGTGGTCTIDVQADGGSAMCDALGGDKAKAGRGKGKRAADGGRCDAVADGGAVTIGDINP